MSPTAVTTRQVQQPVPGASFVRPSGIVTAIVGVTGTVDEGNDLIVPGAYSQTLKLIRPKVVKAHDWKIDTGRVLHAEEWKPGDPRLPKFGPNGQRWPAEAGALVATSQFNLRTQTGRDAFEMAKFYAESGEGCWSIGYKVVPGMTSKRHDGVRVIYELRLYEISTVIHGMHSWTMTLEVKSAGGRQDTMERKTVTGSLQGKSAPAGPLAAGIAVRALDTGRVLMLQRSAADKDDPAAGTWEFPGGHLEPGEAPLDAAQREWGEETGHVFPQGELSGQWASKNGVYRGFIWDVPSEDDVQLNLGHERRHVLNPDDPDGDDCEVGAWWSPPMLRGNPAIRAELSASSDDVLAALGGASRASMEAKTATAVLFEAKSMHAGSAGAHEVPALGRAQRSKPIVPKPRRSAKAAVAQALAFGHTTRMETKAMAMMAGSYEQIQDVVRDAVRDLLHPVSERAEDGSTPWVYLEATFPGYVFAKTQIDGEDQTFRIDYELVGDEVALGAPVPAELTVVAVVGQGAPSSDEDDMVRHVYPALANITEAAGRLLGPVLEGKALQAAVAPAVLGLLDALSVKGVNVPDMVLGDGDDDPEGGEYGPEGDPHPAALLGAEGGGDPDDTSDLIDEDWDDESEDADPGMGYEDDEDDEDWDDEADPGELPPAATESKGVVLLDRADVEAMLADLRS